MSDEILHAFRGEGVWESEGSFTLDPLKAAEKLRAYALDQPRRYILNLVSWAVAAGAVSFDLKARSGRLEVLLPGLTLTGEDLRALFSQAALSGLASSELAIATITASGLPRARVSIGGGDAIFHSGEGGFRLEPHQGQTTFWLLEEPRSVLGWVGRALGEEPLEIPLLREACAHAEIPITVNGSPVYRPADLPMIRRAVHLAGAATLPVELEDLDHERVIRRVSPGSFSALIVDSTSPILPAPAQYIVRGVTFAQPSVQLSGVNFAVLVNAPRLKKDLSCKGLVEDDSLHQIRGAVARAAQELLEG